MTDTTKAQILEVARKAIHTEMLSLKRMEDTLGDEFATAVEMILGSRGKCIVTGMGKSGLVGRKIAATLASTGTPSFFLHPGEAFHGDLGMISKEDIVVALSYSGETDEILKIVPFIHSNTFAISGIRLASAKRFDWFGAYIVGLATAIGGGTLRDVMLNVTPVWMTDPIYLICTAFAMFFVIIFGKYLIHLNNTFFLFDSIGLALFTVVGFGKSISLGYPFWVAIIMGSITGAAGGVIRDVFINEIPLIFRKEIYAMACVIGGLVYWICLKTGMESYMSQILGGVTVFIVRILAVKYQITLPILKGDEENSKE